MKPATLLIILTLIFTNISVKASVIEENPDQAESDAAYALLQGFNTQASQELKASLPEAVFCNGSIIGVTNSKANIFRTTTIFVSSADKEFIVLGANDGDQIFNVKIKITDLIALSTKQLATVTATEVSGFWWADGDHVKATKVTCTMN